jgi:hypothetical protein
VATRADQCTPYRSPGQPAALLGAGRQRQHGQGVRLGELGAERHQGTGVELPQCATQRVDVPLPRLDQTLMGPG